MIKIENTEVVGWEHAIRGMRNPLNSWDKSDTIFLAFCYCDEPEELDIAQKCGGKAPIIKDNDLGLMKRLRNAGTDHRKFMRMLTVYADITAPLYWFKEFDTYKVGTVANSCSTMHKIHAKEFTLDDFSHEHLDDNLILGLEANGERRDDDMTVTAKSALEVIASMLNAYRYEYLKTHDKHWWWQMIQLLPSSYNQKRTVMLNYEVLANIYKSRKNHKLDEWHELCHWIEKLPYAELITE